MKPRLIVALALVAVLDMLERSWGEATTSPAYQAAGAQASIDARGDGD